MDTVNDGEAGGGDAHLANGVLPYCDVVMKGGITSGVVYPLAIIEVSKKYRLKNVGGASAGAIAAGLAAAAEYARGRGGYVRLEGVAREVSMQLPDLFQPTPAVRPIFKAFLKALGTQNVPWRVMRLLMMIFGGSVWPIVLSLVIAILPMVALGVRALVAGDSVLAGVRAGLLWCFVLLVIAVLIWFVWTLLFVQKLIRSLSHQGFGLCPGTGQRGYRSPALTEWLADKIDEIAGLGNEAGGAAGEPLTFGHLWGVGRDGAPAGDDEHWNDPANRRINLEMMTTNLTLGFPCRIPFDANIYMYREDELKQVLPARIVDWMREHSKPVSGMDEYRWLPYTHDLPIVVGIRMSLSFPVLLSAVPLWARDYRRREDKEREVPRRCVFSDGGICANFPIHFFDRPWPAHPTFGIKLDVFQDPYDSGRTRRACLPEAAGEGILPRFTPVDSLTRFFGAVMNAAMGWHENLQSALPGYRGRIVVVPLKSHEGGLNLNMPEDLVEHLLKFGKEAGEELCQKFHWESHRWTRYLVWLGLFEETLERMQASYQRTPTADDNLRDFLRAYRDHPACYRQTNSWNTAAEQNVEELLAYFRESWQARQPQIRAGAIPRPDVELRISPKA